jgi:hypothetical protein
MFKKRVISCHDANINGTAARAGHVPDTLQKCLRQPNSFYLTRFISIKRGIACRQHRMIPVDQ